MSHPSPSNETSTTNILGILLRVYWMLGGSITLAVCALYAAMHPAPPISWADAIYGVTIPLLIAARYADIKHFGGLTSDGEPATMAHWRRYTLWLCIGSAILWLAAHGIAFASIK
jgi:hypothetical protein